MRVLCVGEMMADLLVHPVPEIVFDNDADSVEEIAVKSGGDANNNAIDLAKLGNEVYLVTLAGRDALADNCLKIAQEAGVCVDYTKRSTDTDQTRSLILINDRGDRHFLQYPGTSAKFCFEDVDLSWRANNAGYKNVLCPTAKCYHICGASTGAVKYNAFKSQQSGRNSILLPLKNEPLLMLILNFLPLALGYLLKCYKFHKQGFGEAWDKGMQEAFDLLKTGKLGKRPFRWRDLPHYILMELWMIWNMVPYLWYRLVIVRFDLK